MRTANLPLVARHLLDVVWNRVAKLGRTYRKQARRGIKQVSETAKHTRAQVKHGREWSRDAAQHAYADSVRTTRSWSRLRQRTWPAMTRQFAISRELKAAAKGTGPVIVGPWLSEVGYEALYWVPFVRWFADHYRVDRARLVIVSRGGVSSWYADFADHYVDLLDLFPPQEFAARNAQRMASGDQKQLGLSPFDQEILERVRAMPGRGDARVCHPSAMFRLMRHFWLGNESLQHVLDHTLYAPVNAASGVDLPGLPEHFVAVKFYTGRALPDTPANRATLRALVERISRGTHVVVLNTSIALDEHEDYVFEGLPNVVTLDRWLTPQNNLAVQTEVIRRASLFVGTCGSLAWLAPMLGTETLAVYADEHFLTPHLYAASQVYSSMAAAEFTAVDVRALQTLKLADPVAVWTR